MKIDLTPLFKSLADETRIAILKLLLEKKEICNQTTSQSLNLSQPVLTHHFNKLVSAKILNERKDGKWRFYTLNKPYLREIGFPLEKIIANNQN